MPAITSLSPKESTMKEDSFIIPEAVNALPTKRLFDFNSLKLRESTKLAKEFELSDSMNNELILKVKMVGLNYQTDFQTFKKPSSTYNTNLYGTRLSSGGSYHHNKNSHSQAMSNSPPSEVPLNADSISALVPGNKIIGKIQATTNHPALAQFREHPNSKYLVFPYTNCINQNRNHICANCQTLTNKSIKNLSYKTYKVYHKYPCLENLIYGSTIDGGLQDYLKVLNPADTLIRIPDYVSLHDSCFLLDIMLPFYSFVKDFLMDNVGSSSPSDSNGNTPVLESASPDEVNFGSMLIILNEISKEINDILIVLKHFQIDQKTVSFLDKRKIDKMSDHEKTNYKKMFSQVFVFHVTDETIRFATSCSISPGLESTKSRYNIVLFDQHNPESLSKNKYLNKYHSDKTYHQFKLNHKDKVNGEELLKIISNMNRKVKKANSKQKDRTSVSAQTDNATTDGSKSRPSVASFESNQSTFSHTESSIHSDSTSTTTVSSGKAGEAKPTKMLRFREDDSIIDDSSIKKLSNNTSPRHYSWLWYDKDFYLCNEYEQSDDEDEEFYEDPGFKKTHSVKQVNKLIKNPRQITRVCYTNRSHRPVKLNAFIFS